MSDRSKTTARLQFLGAQRVELGHESLTPDAERLFAMIVRLSVPVGRITSRQTMMDTLWPGVGDANARHNLRQTVYKAREIGLIVESGDDGLRLDPRFWSCDWDDPVGDVGGEWLPDYDPDFSDDLRSWITSQRVGVHALLRPRIVRSMQTSRSAGDLLLANRHAVQLLSFDPLNEEATLTCAETMAMQGAKVDALRLLDAYLVEIGRVGGGHDAALPAQLLRRRIAEKLPSVAYQSGGRHHGPLVGRIRESKRLTAALFDARAGRGAAFLIYGPDGSGKSRLQYEVRKSAVLQGMRVLDLQCDSARSTMPFAALRTLVRRLLDYPGAMGVSPEALEAMRAWLASTLLSPDDCPIAEIEDLLAAVSEETPLLLQLEHAERIDAESLGRLDRMYRRGVSRYHTMMLTSCTAGTPTDAPVDAQWIERLSLRPMNTLDVRSVVAAYAAAEQPRATADQVACAAVFAEGVPMYGIEMLGLMLDAGSPDVIPWRVQVAVDRALRELSELQWRVLALCGVLGGSARQGVVSAALEVDEMSLAAALDGLETSGFVQCEEGVLRASGLMADGAELRVKRTVLRLDALKGGEVLLTAWVQYAATTDFFSLLRLFVASRHEDRACSVLDRYIGSVVRNATAEEIVFEMLRLKPSATGRNLSSMLDAIVERVNEGSKTIRSKSRVYSSIRSPFSLPTVTSWNIETEYTLVSAESMQQAQVAARNPDSAPDVRMAEAVGALFMAANRGDSTALCSAYQAVNGVRHSDLASRFDVYRADLIFFASTGELLKAREAATLLTNESRVVADVQLACTGLRNAAEIFAYCGDSAQAQGLLLESRSLAARLKYHAHTVKADLRLAALALLTMDTEGCRAYLDSAKRVLDNHQLRVPVLYFDLQLYSSWEAVICGDVASAGRAARALFRNVRGSQSGNSLWAVLATKLASHRGKFSKETKRDHDILVSSITAVQYYSNEHLTLAALLLCTQRTDLESFTRNFVSNRIRQIELTDQAIWPFVIKLLCAAESHWEPLEAHGAKHHD